MLTTYAKIKVFPDGEINLTVKQNVKQTPKVVEHAKETRLYNRLAKAENRRIIINELAAVFRQTVSATISTSLRRTRKLVLRITVSTQPKKPPLKN